MRFRALSTLVLLTAVLLAALVTRGGTAEPPLVSSELVGRAMAAGRTRVIVRLGAPFAPEAALATAGEVLNQRLAISSLQSAVESGLRGTAHAVIYRYDALPMLALDVSPDALRMLESLRGVVVEVVEDEWHAPSLAQSAPLVNADEAWSAGFDGAGTIVAVLDTGVDKTHAFFGGGSKVVGEACFSSTVPLVGATSVCPGGAKSSTIAGSGLPCTVPDCDHGTHVAGIAAGAGSSFSGVARGAGILAVQVFSRIDNPALCGSSQPCPLSSTSDQIAGLNYVFSKRNAFPGFTVAAVNMSLGAGSYTSICDKTPGAAPHKLAIDQLRGANIATVVASGNDGFINALASPACISSAVSVGSTTKSDQISGFSNGASFLSLLAPGSSITSSLPGGSFGVKSGTSMASPHVAGAFAILRQRAPNATVSELLSVLQSTGVPVTDPPSGIVKPRIDVFAAVQATRADLVVQTLTVPATVVPGTAVKITVSIKNQGISNAAASTLRLYHSTDATITSGDTLLAALGMPALARGVTSAVVTTTVTIPAGTAAGPSFIGALVDADAAIGEASEANNAKAVGVQVIQPDLAMQALSVPGTGQTGRPLPVANTVRNQGTSAAGAFRVKFFMSPDSDTPGAGMQVGQRDVAGLAAGKDSAAITAVTIPANVSAGNYFVSAVVDTSATVLESNEGNNGLTASGQVTVTLFRPDLTVTAVSAGANAQTGKPLAIASTVKNLAAAPAGAFKVSFYLSSSNAPGTGTLVGSRSVSTLAGTKDSVATTTITVPAALGAGLYFLSAVVEPLQNVELDPSNNGLTATAQVNVTLFRPELTVSALSAPALAKIGKPISITSAVRNTGPAPATAFKVRFYVSPSSATPGDGTAIGERLVASLAPGATVTAVTTFTLPATLGLTEGSYFVSARADAGNQVVELDEDNNGRTATSQIALTLLRPDLTIAAAASTPALASPGFTVNVANTVKNAGDTATSGTWLVKFWLSSNATLDGGDTFLTSRTVTAPVAMNGMTAATTPVTIPAGTTPGAYFLLVHADGDGAFVEYPGDNNVKAVPITVALPNLSVQAITPPKAIIRGKIVTTATPRSSVTIKNAGPGPSAPFEVKVFANRDDGTPGARTPGLGDLLFTKPIPALAPNASITVSDAVFIPDPTGANDHKAGNYYISAIADGANTTGDPDTSNNSLTLVKADLAVLPDVSKLKNTIVTITLAGCSLSGVTLNLTGTFTAGNQTVANPSTFTATLPLADAGVGFNQVYKVSGKVEAVEASTGTAGKVRTSFTYTSTLDNDFSGSGKGMIDASAPSRSLAGTLSGGDTTGNDRCTFAGTVTIDPQ